MGKGGVSITGSFNGGKFSGQIEGLGTPEAKGNSNGPANENGGGPKTMQDLFKTEDEKNGLSFDEFKADVAEGGKMAKASIASAVIEAAGELASAGISMATKMKKFDAEIEIAGIEMQGIKNKFANANLKLDIETGFKQSMMHLDTYMKETENLTRASFKALTDGINQGAWASYNAILDYNLSTFKLSADLELSENKKSLEKRKLANQEQVETIRQQNKIDQLNDDKTRAIQKATTDTVGKIGEAVSMIPNPVSMIVGAIVSAGAAIADGVLEMQYETRKNERAITEKSNEIEMENINQQLEMYGFILDNETDIKKKTEEFGTAIAKMYAELTQQIEGYVIEFNKSATKLQSLYGYVGADLEKRKGADVANGLTSWAVASRIGYEELASTMLDYQNSTGRNMHLSEKDVAMTSFLDKYSGQNGITGRIASEMQNFNKSISDSAILTAKNMASVERSGLSSKKYAKDVEKYIGLANKYNFKNGTEGLMNMLKYAQKTKFNMDSLSGALDKFNGNDISSILESSAKLNVLGGNAALYSDPLGMMFDAEMDPEGFMKRMQASFSEFGTFNKDTGEMEYDFESSKRMRAIAELYGMNVEDMRKQNNEAEKRRQITGQMSGKGFSDDNLDFLISNAFWDKKNGWMANVGGQNMSIDNIGNDMIEKIIPKNTEDRIGAITQSVSEINQNIINFLNEEEKLNWSQKDGQLDLAQTFYSEMTEEFRQRGIGFQSIVDHIKTGMIGEGEGKKSVRDILLASSATATKALTTINGKAQDAYEKLYKMDPMQKIKGDVEALRKKIVGDTNTNPYKEKYDAYYEALKKIYKSGTGDGAGDRLASMVGWNLTSEQKKQIDKTINYVLKKKNFSESEFSSSWTESLGKYGTFTLTEDYIVPLIKNYYSEQERIGKHKEGGDVFTFGSMYSKTANLVTSANDVNMAWQKGGPLDTLFNGVAGKVNVIGDFVEKSTNVGKTGSAAEQKNMNVNVTFGGKAELACNGNQINLASLITNDAFAMRKITEMVLTEISKYNDGRGTVNAYTNVGNIFA